MTRQIDEITVGESATIAGVISDLKAQGYTIKERVSGENTVAGIVLNEENIKMNKNSEAEFTYTLLYAEGTVRYFAEVKGKYYEIIYNNKTITVNKEETELEGIDNEPKVTVKSDEENIVTAKIENNNKVIVNSKNELGEAVLTIKEENSGATAKCNIKVMTLIGQITFNQETINIEKGNNVELSTLVTVNPEDATEELIWTSENKEIAEITEEGILIGVKEGTTTIKVTNEAGTIEATCQVKVIISATGISLNSSSLTINKGDTRSLTATITPEDTTEPVVWTPGAQGIATMTTDATGRTATITAVGAGTTRVIATCGSKTAYCTITVKVPATSVTISPENANIGAGEKLQLTAIVEPSDTTDTLKWSISGTGKNSILLTQDGLVTGRSVGLATVIANCGNKSAKCDVTVGDKLEFAKLKGWGSLLNVLKIRVNGGGSGSGDCVNNVVPLENFDAIGANGTTTYGSWYENVKWDYKTFEERFGAFSSMNFVLNYLEDAGEGTQSHVMYIYYLDENRRKSNFKTSII